MTAYGALVDIARVARGGRANQCFRGKDIVFDGRERLLFHQRHVLEGCGVKDDTRRVREKNFI